MRWAVLTLVLATWAGVAHADDDPFDIRDPRTGRSAQEFAEGRKQLAAGHDQAACDAFERSLILERAAGTELNFAACEERHAHLVEAWRLFVEAARTLRQTSGEEAAARAKFAQDRADALVPKLGTVVVELRGSLENLVLTINNHSATVAPSVSERVTPGRIDVVARPPYHAALEQRVEVEAGRTAAVAFDIPPPPPRVIEYHRSHSWMIASGVFLLGAVTSFVVAANVGHGNEGFPALVGVSCVGGSFISFVFAPDDP